MHSAQTSTTLPSGATSTETSLASSLNSLPPKQITSFYYRGVNVMVEMPDAFTKVAFCKLNHLPGEVYQCTADRSHLLCRHCLKHEQPASLLKQSGTPDDAAVYLCPFDNTVTYPDKYTSREIKSSYLPQCPSNTAKGDTHCQWHGLYNDVLKHVDLCPNFPLGDRILMLQHARSEATGSLSALDIRIEQLINQVEQLGSLLLKKPESPIDVKIKSLEKNIDLLKQQLQRLTGDFNVSLQNQRLHPSSSLISGLQQRITNLEKLSRENSHTIKDLENQLANAFHLIDQLMKAKAVQENPVAKTGTLLWKIDNFESKRTEAITKKNTLFSPVFWTSENGYKLCARIYLDGDGPGRQTHISLFLVVMKGDYDDFQRWPFRHKVSFTILDPNGQEHLHDSFRPNPDSSSFQRPKKDYNIASGCPTLMELSKLDKYVKDDTMLIKISIDTKEP